MLTNFPNAKFYLLGIWSIDELNACFFTKQVYSAFKGEISGKNRELMNCLTSD